MSLRAGTGDRHGAGPIGASERIVGAVQRCSEVGELGDARPALDRGRSSARSVPARTSRRRLPGSPVGQRPTAAATRRRRQSGRSGWPRPRRRGSRTGPARSSTGAPRRPRPTPASAPGVPTSQGRPADPGPAELGVQALEGVEDRVARHRHPSSPSEDRLEDLHQPALHRQDLVMYQPSASGSASSRSVSAVGAQSTITTSNRPRSPGREPPSAPGAPRLRAAP